MMLFGITLTHATYLLMTHAASIDVTKESTVTTTISMSINDDKPWFDAHEEFDLWYDTPETMDNYQEWDDPPIILKDTSKSNESPKEYIDPDL